MVTTPHVGLTLVEQSQSQKEVTVNEAFTRIDALMNSGVIDKDLSTPPGSPSAGDVYIVGSSATGDWSGEDDNIAYFDQIWRFVTPNEGMTLWVNDEDDLYSWDGNAWQRTNASVAGNFTIIADDPVQTIQATSGDATLRFIADDAPTDETRWQIVTSDASGGMFIQTQNDDTTGTINAIQLLRTGNNVDEINLAADTINLDGDVFARQLGGTVGQDEILISHNGDQGKIECHKGHILFTHGTGKSFFFDSTENSIRPAVDNQLDIGTSVRRWKNVYLTGDVMLSTVGKGITLKEGSNARMGSATLSSGAVTVNNTSVTANTRIFLTSEGSSTGVVRVSSRVASTSFTITSTDGSSSDAVHWLLFEPS